MKGKHFYDMQKNINNLFKKNNQIDIRCSAKPYVEYNVKLYFKY